MRTTKVQPSPEAGASLSKSSEAAKQSEPLKGIDYATLVPILIAAMQEQQARIEALERKRK